ncbi:MAG: hypothetical protein COZ06_37440 [Armatimonadetes bacterium CG_4_10_14_3_um_filter_66_18]|nr:hypothetical protein [Armatimonadota bacterium]OIP04171.1 MAG: hypothetical protein AUJ96_13405 [Armatimonadetes bacterium CG2_30_66_41]PIU95729.1 MAG: hypothetical protein COS65_00955 [Armatimonadetes bacterium CG06_land_8_20_14_3_00_66_21]PIX44438.1 MAG: hypothetical protein COZ57_17560 [Armatimonadetes bacterium CG_4_8_14_3_um_filter_66_20]PIY35874.1 MAG: hypothetical protein COZ06_37440 [Armatimonadetes bacterium CG_4_10_14_3_um_filter_66_18]PIZ39074.1 MAG: hypothetical protein COY42_22
MSRPAPSPTEDGTRRDFFRQSAQVAAASLFAGAALEDVVERVVHRVGESQAMQRLAGDVAKNLRGVQLQSQAHACCT